MSNSTKDDLRPEYNLNELKGGARGKYAFPNTKAVNDALRELLATQGQNALRNGDAMRSSD
jgi:hypothetical protein